MFLSKNAQKIAYIKNYLYLCTRKGFQINLNPFVLKNVHNCPFM